MVNHIQKAKSALVLGAFAILGFSVVAVADFVEDGDPVPGNGSAPLIWEDPQPEDLTPDRRGQLVNAQDLSSFDLKPAAEAYGFQKRSIDQLLTASCETIRENRLKFPQQLIRRTTQYFTPMFAPGENGRLQAQDRRSCINMEGSCIVDKLLYNWSSPSEPWGVFYDRDQVLYKFGKGSGANYYNTTNALDPCRTVAADRNVYPVGTVLYIPSMRDKICPQSGKTVDGCFVVGDVGSAIRGQGRFDFFTGECAAYNKSSSTCGDSLNQHFIAEAGSPFYVIGRYNMWAKQLREEADLHIRNNWQNFIFPPPTRDSEK